MTRKPTFLLRNGQRAPYDAKEVDAYLFSDLKEAGQFVRLRFGTPWVLDEASGRIVDETDPYKLRDIKQYRLIRVVRKVLLERIPGYRPWPRFVKEFVGYRFLDVYHSH